MDLSIAGVTAAQPQRAPGRYGPALAILATVFFMWGFISVLNDVLAPHLKSVFELTYFKAMLVQGVFFSAYFLMSMPAAWALERIGYKRSIALGLVVTGLGALIFVPAATLPSYGVFLTGLFVLATGITILQVAANAYVAILGPAKTSSSRLNLVQAFNSLGTTLAPWFGGAVILARSTSGAAHGETVLSLQQRMQDALAVRAPYVGIAIVLFILAAVIFAWKLPAMTSARGGAATAHGDSVWRHPRLILGIVAIFLYVGAEVAVGSVLINYIASSGVGDMSHEAAAKYVSYFWFGAMAGRFIGAGLMRKIEPGLLLGLVTAGALVLICTSIMTGGQVALWSIVLVGLCNSIMFPTIFTLSIEGLGPLTGRGSGLLIMAIAGGGLLPLIQGFLADHIGLRLSFIAPAACYLYLLFFALRAKGAHPGAPALEGEAPHVAG
jgi:FHS family L-fucose permease-like MFS transporter